MAVFSVGASAPRSSIVLFLVAAALAAGELPSCESDTAEHCLAEGADLSSEGIDACLSALGDAGRSEQCNSYLKLMANCKPDYGRGGVCEDGHMNGETAACLIQRVAPEKLSEACRNALPVKEEAKGLFGLHWKDGKRELSEDELGDLFGDELDTYLRWIKKKKGAKTERGKERDYAIRTAKKASASKSIVSAAAAAARAAKAAGEDAKGQLAAAQEAADAAAAEAVDGDMTGTLKPFTRSNIKGFVADAMGLLKEEL